MYGQGSKWEEESTTAGMLALWGEARSCTTPHPQVRGCQALEEWVRLGALLALDEEPAVAPAEGQEGESGA